MILADFSPNSPKTKKFLKMTKKPVKSNQALLKFLCDYLPIIIFFLGYKFFSGENRIILATVCMVIATFFGIAIGYFFSKKIPKIAAFSALILAFFCGLSIYFDSEKFIKIKPTIVNLAFAAIIYFGIYRKKPFLKNILAEQIHLSEQDWMLLFKRWAGFFVFLAIINELVWRNFPTDFWVNFKVFGLTGLTLIFTICQMPLMMKGKK